MSDLLQNYCTATAQKYPNAIAIRDSDTSITYRELDERSNQLAHTLKGVGCAQGDRICIAFEKSIDAIVAMHGVLKADCVYVPLDSSSPAARVARIVKSCEPRMIVADTSAIRMLDDVFANHDVDKVDVGSLLSEGIKGSQFSSCFDGLDIDRSSVSPLPFSNQPNDSAHILFTSGSTGEPKGVVIKHENVVHFVNWGTGYFQVEPGERVSNHAPFHFDLSTYDIYGALASGAELHLVAPSLNLVPAQLAKFIRESKLTQWFSVPSVLTQMIQFEAIEENDFPDLKRLMWCGEALPTPILMRLMELLPHVEFTNLYGPTEATIASSFYTVPVCPNSEMEQVPIGTACEGEELLVLDEELNVKANGETGDLYLAGNGLSPGYWQDPEKTDSVFVDWRKGERPQRIYKTGDLAFQGDDGLVYFLGRSDTQIKSRGHRIELGEIEAAFNTIESLQECAVVAIPTSGFDGHAICCAYVSRPDEDVTPIKLRQKAAKLLPKYMLPAKWKELSSLPKNANGKIDRPALKELFSECATV